MATKKKKAFTNKVPPVTIKNATIIWRNFTGQEKQFNPKGARNFHLVLDDETANLLIADGWNVRWHDPREENDPEWATIKVALRFDNYPPRIVLFAPGSKKTVLDEESVDVLDWAEFDRVDVILSPSSWEVNGKSGIKAYLRKMVVSLSADDLESGFALDLDPNDQDKELPDVNSEDEED